MQARQNESNSLDIVAKNVYDFSRAVLVGYGQGLEQAVEGIVNTIFHPIQAIQCMGELAYCIGSIIYDATLISAGHLNTSSPIHQIPNFDSLALDFARHGVQSNPQLYLEAQERMEVIINQLKAAGVHFVNQPWPEQVRIATKALTSFGAYIIVTGAVLNSIKAVANLQKYGIPYNPPSFHYWMERHWNLMSHPIYDLADIRALKGEHPCLYALMEKERRLIISPQFQIQEKMVTLENGQVIKRAALREIKHSELTKYAPVFCAGEVRFTDGLLTMINRDSGRYLAFGPHIPKMVEEAFHKFGITESIGKFMESQAERGSPLAIRVFNKMGLTPPGAVPGGIVQNLISEGAKTQQKEGSDLICPNTDNKNPEASSDASDKANIVRCRDETSSYKNNNEETSLSREKITRYQVNFDFNEQHHRLNLPTGLMIHMAENNNPVIASSCQNGICDIALRTEAGSFAQIQVPYNQNQAVSQKSKPLSTVSAGTHKLQTSLGTLQTIPLAAKPASPPASGAGQPQKQKGAHNSRTDPAIKQTQSSTKIIMEILSELEVSEHRSNYNRSEFRCPNFSPFRESSPPINYCSSSEKALNLGTFGYGFLSGRCSHISPVDTCSAIEGINGCGQGKSGYCDPRTGDCRGSGSSTCKSSLKM